MAQPDKRHDVLSAALALFATRGFHGTPMSLIAERAEVAVGTIYCHFESKDVLIVELYTDIEKRIMAIIDERYPQEKPFRECFIHLGSEVLRYFIVCPLDFRYLEQFHNSPYGAAYRRDKLLGDPTNGNTFRELFEYSLSQQLLKTLPLSMLLALFFGPLLYIARDCILGFVELDEEMIHRIVEACLDAIKR